MAKIPLHNLLDKSLGFSLRDLVLATPEEREEFRKQLDKLIEEAEAKERLEEEERREAEEAKKKE